MSSNPAEAPAVTPARLRRTGTWSLTTRLALLASFSSFAILFLISIQMYLLLADQLKEQSRQYLRDEVEHWAQWRGCVASERPWRWRCTSTLW